MHVLITGGTGFIGLPLIRHLLEKDHRVTVLTRDASRAKNAVPSGVACLERLDEAHEVDAVVNLAGEPLFGKRWNPELKERFLSSRIDGTRAIVDWMRGLDRRPQVFLSASAIGYYGDAGNRKIDESGKPADDFAAQLCVEWERAALPAEELGVRTCLLRIGLVLGLGSGVLGDMLPIFKKGVGGPIGSGQQYMSWIHMDDMVGLIDHALTHEDTFGPLNCTAPSPVTNASFAKTLGRAVGRPAFIRTPAVVLKLALGESAYMVLTGQRVVPTKALETGYTFRYPELEPAVAAVLADDHG